MRKLSMFVGFAAMTALVACNQKGGGTGNVVSVLSDSTVVMKYEGGSITAKEVNSMVEPKIKRFNEEAIETYQQAAERVLMQKLIEAEVKKQGLSSPQELFNKEAAPAAVNEGDVAKFMKENNLDKPIDDPRTGKKRKVSKEEVKAFMEQQSRQKAEGDFVQKLMAAAKAQFMIEEARTSVPDSSDAPFKGGANAKVVVTEFSDFQCPFCVRATDSVNEIHKAYGDKVKIVYRHFPLDFHPQAKPAAEASVCLNKQGKFWPFHDKVFANQKELTTENIDKWVKELGADMAAYKKCMDAKEGAKVVERDMADAEKTGVNSTPTFFVNGKKVAGALPFARFKTMIDAELARAR